MARAARHDILFEPVRIGPKTLRNRFYQVPHCTGFGTEKPWSQAALREVKAEGGWAAVNTEYAPIGPDSDVWPDVASNLWDDGDARSLSLMCDAAHRHGALAGIELTHALGHSLGRESRTHAIAPSQLASDWDPMVVPMAMRRSDIERVQRDWADAAIRARDAGFDIVYVYGAHSFGPMQFLSPYYNHRDDEYGGTLRNRARFWLETLQVVRDAVGGDCAVAARIPIDALGPAGVELDEGLAFVRMADDLVDLWDVNVGSIVEWSKDSGSSRFFKAGYQLEWTGRVREVTDGPIVGVGRITDPDQMAEIVRSGAWDLIGAARPSMADPYLPVKIEQGRYDEIRECIGCNICISKSDWSHHVGCTQNATLGEEYRRGWHPERFTPARNADRNVLVVGAGPAGMECAVVLAKRGMSAVHLVDARPDVGGHLSWLTRLPGLGEWGRLVDHRRVQLARQAAVSVIVGTELDVGSVLDYGAQIVVVATGSSWSRTGINAVTHAPVPGLADAPADRVLTPEDVVGGATPPGERVVVYDCEGYHTGAAVAERLAGNGHRVELVTPLEQVAPFCDQTLEGPLLRRRLHDRGVRMRRETTIDHVTLPGTLVAHGAFDEPVEIEADAVVLATQRVSDDALYHRLMDRADEFGDHGVEHVLRIGDCVAPRLIADAIFDGHRLGREIDSDAPDVPLPYRRELPITALDGVRAALR